MSSEITESGNYYPESSDKRSVRRIESSFPPDLGKSGSGTTVSVVQYQIRVFDDLNLAFIKPFEVTNEFDRSVNNKSNKTD